MTGGREGEKYTGDVEKTSTGPPQGVAGMGERNRGYCPAPRLDERRHRPERSTRKSRVGTLMSTLLKCFRNIQTGVITASRPPNLYPPSVVTGYP